MLSRVGLARVAAVGVSLALALILVLAVGPGKAAAQQREGGGRGGAGPNLTGTPSGPDLAVGSYALMDAETGLYLTGEKPDERLAIASTTKIMVALLALERGTDLDKEVVISDQAESYVGYLYSNVGLISGERLSVKELLTASLVPSGTDAVYALAEHLGGGGGKAGVEKTVEKMNEKAKELGLRNTHFENPAGLPVRGHYSSARDLATIAREAMRYKAFRQIVAEPEATITTQDRPIDVTNTNLLLLPGSSYYANATGIKTGTSPASGPCLVASANKGDESYLAVVLDARSDLYRFDAVRKALEFGFARFDRKPLVEEDGVYKKAQLPFRPEESVRLAAAGDVRGISGPGLKVERRITTDEPPPSARAGQELGTVEVIVDGKSVGSSPLVAAKGYEEAGFWQKTRYRIKGLIDGISKRFSG